MDKLRKLITDVLDVLAVLAAAVGVTLGLYPRVDWWSLVAGGAVVFAAVRVDDWQSTRAPVEVRRQGRANRAKARRTARATRAALNAEAMRRATTDHERRRAARTAARNTGKGAAA